MNTLTSRVKTRFPLLAEARGFRKLWLATFVSSLGDWMGFVALNLYVFNLTGSATALAGLLAMEAIPAMLISPFAGVIVDRFSRRKVIVIANLAAMVAFLLLFLTQTLWQIYMLALVARATTTFIMPAERALLPDLIGKTKVIEGNTALSVIRHVTLIAGPAVAGVLVAASSASVAFLADAVTFAIASIFIAQISGEIPRTGDTEGAEPGWLDDLKVGLRYALGNKAIQVILITTLVSSIAAAALLTIEVIYISDFLQGGDEGYGLLLSVAGLGALFSSSSAGRLARRFNISTLYAVAVLLTGLFFFPYANIHILWVAIMIGGLHTIPWVLGMILVDTMLQQWVPDDMRGRVFSLISAERNAGHVLVAALLAPLVDWWGPVLILNIAGLIYTIAGIYVLAQVGILHRQARVSMSVGVGG